MKFLLMVILISVFLGNTRVSASTSEEEQIQVSESNKEQAQAVVGDLPSLTLDELNIRLAVEISTSEILRIIDNKTLRVVIPHQLLFNYDQSNINKPGQAYLDQIIDTLKPFRLSRVIIEGHLDSDKSTAYNMMLSDLHAKAVAEYMINYGISRSQITWLALGREQPFSEQETEESNKLNSRIEIHISVN